MRLISLYFLIGCCIPVFAILTPVTDPISWDKYLLSYISPNAWDRAIANNETALSLGKIITVGDHMSCYVPNNLTSSSNLSEELDEEHMDEYLATVLEKGVDIVTTSITDCLTYYSGFWRYEYCPNANLTQFHGDLKTTSLLYVLAKAKASVQDREFRLLCNDFGYYISEIIGSGDICDMTGYPRVVDLQYVCGPATGSASIKWVREHKTCHYEVQIAVPSLCDLELLSKNGDKKFSTPLVCSKEGRNEGGAVDIITEFEPIFMGNALYLLKPYNPEGTNRTALLYTGSLPMTDSSKGKENDILLRKFNQVIGRMLLQELVLSPDGFPFQNGDEVSWMSEVFDLEGNFLTMVEFNVSSSSFAQIRIDPSLTFNHSGNFLYYKRNPRRNELVTLSSEKDGFMFGSQESLDLKDMIEFVFEKIESDDQTVLDETDYLLEEIMSPEQLADLLEKLGRSTQKRKARHGKEDGTIEEEDAYEMRKENDINQISHDEILENEEQEAYLNLEPQDRVRHDEL